MSQPPHVIPRSEVHRLRATNIDQEYRISIALPRGYGSDDRRYPVLLVLDADMGFGTVVEGHRLMSLDGAMEEILIVGIGYPVDDFLDTLTLRTRDLTPSVDADALAELSKGSLGESAPSFIGGAEPFLDFIRHELLPFLESRYLIDPADRGLAGVSFGGLFGAWCLFQHPGVFNRFMVNSPSLWWDDGIMFRCERAHWSRSHRLEAQVFLSVGGSESARMVRSVRRLATTLRRRSYEGLRLAVRVFPDQVHRSVGGGAMWTGLRELYGRPEADA